MCCRFLLLAVIVVACCLEGGNFASSAVANLRLLSNGYTALAADSAVFEYRRPPNDRSSVIPARLLFDSNPVCDTLIKRLRHRVTEQFSFPCECFPLAGVYTVIAGNSTIAVPIEWTDISLIGAVGHTVLTHAYSVTAEKRKRLCRSEYFGHSTAYLAVDYKRKENERYRHLLNDSFSTLRTIEIDSLRTLGRRTIPCYAFDRSGVYRVSLMVNAFNRSYTIAETSPIHVRPHPSYKLQMRTDGIFPHCKERIAISFKTPRCQPTNSEDRVRLYAIGNKYKQGILLPTRLRYLGERTIEHDGTSVEFKCSNFDSDYVGFCFKLVTVFNDGTSRIQATQCVPTDSEISIPSEGVWGPWGAWSECTFGGCDDAASFRHRVRLCERHPTQTSVPICLGNAVDTQTCTLADDNAGRLCDDSTDIAIVDYQCSCGCTIGHRDVEQSGIVVGSSGLCPKNRSNWIIVGDNSSNTQRRIAVRLLLNRLLSTDRLSIRCDRRLIFASDNTEDDDVFVAASHFYSDDEMKVACAANKNISILFESRYAERRLRLDRSGEFQGLVIDYRPDEGRQNGVLLAPMLAALVLFWLLLACFYFYFWKHTRRKIYTNCNLLAGSDTFDDGAGVLTELLPQKPDLDENKKDQSADVATKPKMVIGTAYRAECDVPMPAEMHTSTKTDTTRLSVLSSKESPEMAAKAAEQPARRSIGIQLTCNSPSLTRQTPMAAITPSSRQSQTSANNNNHQQRPPSSIVAPTAKFGSELSLAGTEQDFEYDYFEFEHPPSFLHTQPSAVFQSEIDIDQIIGESSLFAIDAIDSARSTVSATPRQERDVSTQIKSNGDRLLSPSAEGLVPFRKDFSHLAGT